jgi:tetrapyrrole methylase family protein/MazG family protein
LPQEQRSQPGARSRAARSAARHRARRAGALFDRLVALQARLRSPQGCPWDREQTHKSLRTYLLEETYEVLEALDSGESARLAAELGDLLLQVVFHARLAEEAGRFDVADVLERIHAKMDRRHPHVFGAVSAKTSAEVLRNWEQIKAGERWVEGRGKRRDAEASRSSAPPSLLEGVPRTLPALLEAYQLTRRAASVGFDWDDIEGLFEKLKEETAELREALGKPDPAHLEEEVGDLLFVAVNVARFLGVDPEIALKNANRKFAARFKEMERQAARVGRGLADSTKEEMEVLWGASKGKSFRGAARAPVREAGGHEHRSSRGTERGN